MRHNEKQNTVLTLWQYAMREIMKRTVVFLLVLVVAISLAWFNHW